MKILLFFILLFPLSANALTVAYGMGEHSFKTDKQRLLACTVAENKALKDALLKFSEKDYSVYKETRCIDSKEHSYCDYIKEMDAFANGSIRRIVERDQRVDVDTCFIKVKVEIEPAKVLNATVDVTRFYKPGESIDIKVEVGQPLYLYIFNLHQRGVDMLFPNQYTKDSLIDDRFVYPQLGVTVVASLADDKDISNETLLFLFTKRRQDFSPEFVTKQSLEGLLKSIPVLEKKLVQKHIVIKRGNYGIK